ncbi:hypothetical protein BDW22DRAFT_122436 [Trametopsis cervina]|nr:hypothetical protein BDW22DRAFT_122436 [Trametopsis cervina]
MRSQIASCDSSLCKKASTLDCAPNPSFSSRLPFRDSTLLISATSRSPAGLFLSLQLLSFPCCTLLRSCSTHTLHPPTTAPHDRRRWRRRRHRRHRRQRTLLCCYDAYTTDHSPPLDSRSDDRASTPSHSCLARSSSSISFRLAPYVYGAHLCLLHSPVAHLTLFCDNINTTTDDRTAFCTLHPLKLLTLSRLWQPQPSHPP